MDEKLTPEEAWAELCKLQKRYGEFQKEHNRQFEEIRDRCDHNWQYHPDPSGNNDSGYCCTGCGKWTKRV